ncbi:MAG: FUSC family protein [Acetobacteraceae bacterium]|nr:FUSC family protein [Acetobacteraceae bacterium]
MQVPVNASQEKPDGAASNRLVSWDAVYSLNIAVACLITYVLVTHLLSGFTDRDSDYLGGMWAVVAVVFVFRDTRAHALSAGMARLIATCVSFALCLPYLLLFPFTPVGMAVLLGLGTLVMAVLGRRDDITTTGITTAVVMVVAAMSPSAAWQQPLLRLFDTVVGIALGVIFKWLGSWLYWGSRSTPE